MATVTTTTGSFEPTSNFIPSKALNTTDSAVKDMLEVPKGYLERHTSRPYVSSMDEYRRLYDESINDPYAFWAQQARQLLSFDTDFHTTHTGSFASGDNAWFLGGRLNAAFNCVDRHALRDPDKVAIIFEADEPGEATSITYGELMREVSRLAWVLKSQGVRKGDTVAIYLPAIPAGFIALLACVRIGAIHSAVFAGFSPASLRDRVLDAQSKVVITADEGRRGGKSINLKKITDDAVVQCPDVTSVVVYKRTGASVPWTPERDVWWQEEASKFPAYLAPEPLDSEDPMFLLYTSGSTGKPKGLMHTTAGYLTGAAVTCKYALDLHKEDVYFCTGDLGWITGHTYSLYGPLLLGATVVIHEGTPGYPTFSRYWDIIDEHRVTHFYTAPTTLRLLRRAGDDLIRHKMAHLRLIACVGEPIAAEVWNWVYKSVGKEQAHIVDTFFQTESGAHLLSPFGGVTPTKAGSVTLPFFGIQPVILDPRAGQELKGQDVEGVLAVKIPWPSMARSVWRAHPRYMDTYFNVYKDHYFTGDGAGRDKDGYYWVRGRVDDVINVSAHRISTAEIEAALLESPKISEAAVIGAADDLAGQAVNAFVSLKPGKVADCGEFTEHVRTAIGAFAAPKTLFVVDDLLKTRSGKIMRRILRKIVSGEEDSIGDTSTLSDPSVVERLISTVCAQRVRTVAFG